MLKLLNAPMFQLLLDHPSTTLWGCLICVLAAVSVGCWLSARAKRFGKPASVLAVLLVAVSCTLAAYIAGFVSSRELARQQDFATAEAQYLDLDFQREELYEAAMELVGKVDELEKRVSLLDPKSETRILPISESINDLSNDLVLLQKEADRQHTLAKQIRSQYPELSFVVHTGKMLAELDKQSGRLQKIQQQWNEIE